MQDRQQRALIYNQCAPPHPDPSSHRTARPSITFPRRAARNPKPPCATQPEPRTQDLLAPRNQNPEPKTSSRRATRTQNVPDSSRSGLVVTAAACRYSFSTPDLDIVIAYKYQPGRPQGRNICPRLPKAPFSYLATFPETKSKPSPASRSRISFRYLIDAFSGINKLLEVRPV